MLRLRLRELPIGAKLRHDVFSTSGQLLLSRGTQPSPSMIDRLERQGIIEVVIYEETTPAETIHAVVNNQETDLLQSFSAAQSTVTRLAEQIINQQDINMPELDSTAQSIYAEVTVTNNIIKYLNKLRQANEYTLNHSVSVSVLGVKIAQCIGVHPWQLKSIAVAGLLHDIGKYRISSDILNKPGPLTEEEEIEMQRHPVYGFRMVQAMNLGSQVEQGVLQHHEQINGRGYPVGLRGDKIELTARIVAVADVFDALTSIRAYSKPVTPFKAAEEMRRCCFGHLDPLITRRFLLYLLNVTPGDQVFLNNGETARVVLFNYNNPNRPLVRTDSRFIDLEQEYEYHIVGVL